MMFHEPQPGAPFLRYFNVRLVNRHQATLTQRATTPADARQVSHRRQVAARASVSPPVPPLWSALSPSPRPVLPAYASAQGQFVSADAAHVAEVGALYLQSCERDLVQAPTGPVGRVTAAHLAVDLTGASPASLGALRATGRSVLSNFYYFTSGAGLWSRGGGQVKALVPFNLAELVSASEQKELSQLSDVLNAHCAADVLAMTGTDVPPGQTIEQVAAARVAEAKARIDEIVTQARQSPKAMTPLIMKLVQAAILSRNGGAYVPFDVWTSQQTHSAIAEALEHFKTHFAELEFHPDAGVQRQVIDALAAYLDESLRRGETHLFGYQEGLPAFDPATGKPLEGTPLIGEGAGRAPAWLEKTGRAEQLRSQGKQWMSFENIEVLTDWEAVLGAHAQAGKPVSVVLVPQQEGYKGGNPFLVTKPDGTHNLELHEQSALPAELKDGNAFFNSNTMVQPLKALPHSPLGFEVKNNHTQVRAKQNAGDVTQSLPTAGIGGRLGVEYENFKTYPEYVAHGVALIDTYRGIWARDLAVEPPASADYLEG